MKHLSCGRKNNNIPNAMAVALYYNMVSLSVLSDNLHFNQLFALLDKEAPYKKEFPESQLQSIEQ